MTVTFVPRHGYDKPESGTVQLKNPATLEVPPKNNKTYLDTMLHPGDHNRVNGLGLTVTPNGARTWTYTYSFKGQQRRKTIADQRVLSTWKAARKEARKLQGKVAVGIDPLAELDTEKLVRKTAKAAEHAAAQAAEAALTTAQVWERWCTSTPDKRRRTRHNERNIWTNHLAKPLGGKPIAGITLDDLEKLNTALASTPVQRNRVLTLLSSIMNHAIKHGWRTTNPVRLIKRKPDQPREVRVQPAERYRLLRVLDKADDQVAAAAIQMLLYTGARLSEVLRATWAEIPDFGDPVWHRPKDHMKAGKASSLPLSAETITLLRRQPRTRSPYIFPSQPFGGRRFDLKDTWYAVRKEADLPTLRLHDLRHVFASQMLESGVPLDAVGMLLAHSSQSAKHAITLRYAERSLDSLRQLSAAGATELARRE